MKLYPTQITVQQDIGKDGIAASKRENELLDCRNAIRITLNINTADCKIEDVKEALNEAFQSILVHYQK